MNNAFLGFESLFSRMNVNKKGNIGLVETIADLTKKGYWQRKNAEVR